MRNFWMIAGLALGLAPSCASATVIYDSIQNPLPGNVPSVGYQATQTVEFGDEVQFTGTERQLTSVMITMSDWAKHSDWASYDAAGFTVPLTLELYAVDDSGTVPKTGALIASVSINALIQWRPENTPGPNCTDGWGPECFHGLAQNVTFNVPSGVTVPDKVIYGVKFNTESYGDTPIGVDGPYDSLNVGLGTGASVGTDVNPDAVFWNTGNQGFLTSGTAGTFSQDTDWASSGAPMAQFNAVAAVPEPISLSVFGAGLAGIGAIYRRRRKVKAS